MMRIVDVSTLTRYDISYSLYRFRVENANNEFIDSLVHPEPIRHDCFTIS